MSTKILSGDGLVMPFETGALVDDLVAKGFASALANGIAVQAKQFMDAQPADQPVPSTTLLAELGRIVLATPAAAQTRGDAPPALADKAPAGGQPAGSDSSGPVTGGVTVGADGKPKAEVKIDVAKVINAVIDALKDSTTDKDKARKGLLDAATEMFGITQRILDLAKAKNLSDADIARLKALIDKFQKDIKRASDALDKGETDDAKKAAEDALKDAEQIKAILGL